GHDACPAHITVCEHLRKHASALHAGHNGFAADDGRRHAAFGSRGNPLGYNGAHILLRGHTMVSSRLAIIGLSALSVIGISAGAFATQDSKSAPTFNKDVLPILQKNCQTCHRPGEVAPMSFLTYKDARPWAKAMKDAVVKRQMPPWFADPG